jgi:diamine N-acetyltransferase
MDQFIIRPIKPEEVDALRELAIRIFYEAFAHVNSPENIKDYTDKAYAYDQLRTELEDPRSEHYFLCYGDLNIGFIKLNLPGAQSDLNEPDTLELQRIYVDMAYQNRGLGKLLLDKAKECAAAHQVKFLWLAVWEHNPDAIRFYERHGFVKFGAHPFVMGDDEQTDIMMKYIV